MSAGRKELTELGRVGRALDWFISPGENEDNKPPGKTGGVIVAMEAEDRLSEVVSTTPNGDTPTPKT